MLLDLSDTLHSDAFAQRARHPDCPRAFTRRRQLPLPALVASLLCMRGSAQQCHLDAFFGSLAGSAGLVRGVSDRAFAKARSHLHVPALVGLNSALLASADAAGLVPRWQGFRLVAADASVLMPAIRRCTRTRGLAAADQRLFALYLPGAELTLHAAVHSACESERAMLANALDVLRPGDVLLLDRGYPAAWLVHLLNARGISFIIRCDTVSGGCSAVRQFMREGLAQAQVDLSAPSKRDAADWGCPALPPKVRLVRQVAPNGQVRVLMTNLPPEVAPAAAFGDLYHRRWRIEEAFKRLKHRLHIEAVSGLSQHAVLVDVAAKILADNIASLMCLGAQETAQADAGRQCLRCRALHAMQRVLPRALLLIGDALAIIAQAFTLLARSLRRRKTGRSSPRSTPKVKPHPSMAYKG